MRVLIVDDSIDKIADIILMIQSISSSFAVDSVYSSIGALNKLKTEKYDLLIFDVFLPVRDYEKPDEIGGYNLISQIAREKKIIQPSYILGLTQFSEINSPIFWPVLKYERSSIVWQSSVKELVNHIVKVNNSTSEIRVKPCVFLEGITDRNILRRAFELFDPSKMQTIDLKSEKSAGASWVARQIVSWSCQLQKNGTENYVKAVGVLDQDNAGNEANAEINRMIIADGAQSKTFKVIKLNAKYAEHLKPVYNKGLILPVTLESLFPIELWKYAEQKNWLEKRTDGEQLLREPKNWDKYTCGILEHVKSLGLNDEELLFLKQVKHDCKEQLVSHILSQEEQVQRKMLSGFEILIKDILEIVE